MSKPDSYPNPDSVPHNQKNRKDHNESLQAPLSGSKKTKQRNHVSHNNPQG
ncbi:MULTISPECIES: small acid-soluble spore protein P [Paenibacillus]|jgi:small acid-soluble spore protein P (minor)|uniref:Putative small acid-soluble spore protein P n=1 Tax=Paenibacillus agaridevorans TaxID=171404 RepID=A0A2R5EII4_9BACL|nr:MULTISPECIES: small acid-soluble spore protein P [Paenibacillus]QNK58204.1 small acid-soluble spore protein P [Paenibacillus sp. PAMC21692]GBG06416.1 putative small acid-soluble spore protein P [Paenibacillus agaridevorans]